MGPDSSPVGSAAEAGLVYVTDNKPGITRAGEKPDFVYTNPKGEVVEDEATLRRIRGLVIPPNWTNVWICPNPRGHLQATGRDAKGRKQYRYHPRYRASREETKYRKLALFGKKLPNIRRKVQRHLSKKGLPREKVLATVVRLMDLAHIRIGNEEYAQQNKSFGLTTMRNRHVKVKGSKILFHFRGKSGQDHSLVLEDKRLAAIVKRCRDLPGYELFQYVDARGDHISIDSGMVNDYLREISGEDITAKDFRTWHGTVHAATLLGDCATGECSDAELKRNVVAAVKEVAKKLGNRPATCRKYYIHPLVLEAYEKGTLTLVRGGRSIHLSPQEQAVMKLLEEKPKQAKRIAELAAAA